MKKDKPMYKGVLYALSFTFLSIGISSCEKTEWKGAEEGTEFSELLNLKQVTKSSAENIDTTLNVSADGFFYFEMNDLERNCGCVPPIKVEIVTGVPVFIFPLAETYKCDRFSIEYTINGSTYSDPEIFSTSGSYVTNVRLSYGQICSGSVTLKCKNTDESCAGYGNPCSRTVHFSLIDDGGTGRNPNSCNRYYGDVSVEVVQAGQAKINVVSPSMTFNEMRVSRCDIYLENTLVESVELDEGENWISFSLVGNYWLKMYNPAECSYPNEHFLRCSLGGGTGAKYVEEINNQH